MRSKRKRIAVIRTVVLGLSATVLGGCTHVAPAALETFVADLFRSAAAALLL